MPATSRSRSGVQLDNVEHLLAKGAHELLRIHRPHTSYHAGREVFLDAVGRIGERSAQEPRLELLAVGAVIDPFARGGDPLAGRDGCGVTNDGHHIPVAARLGTQDAKAIFNIVIGDALDQSSQNFLG